MENNLKDILDQITIAETNGHFDKHLTTLSDPQSISSEQYRLVSSKLLQLQKEKGIKKIGVTSSIKGEGKTLTVINLAISLGQSFKQKVCVVELDLKNPGIQKLFGTNKELMLDKVVDDYSMIKNEAIKLCDGNVMIFPCGSDIENHAHFLNSHNLENFLSDLTKIYNFVLIDTPPLLPVVDVQLIANYLDGLLFVVRSGETPKEVVLQALKSLKKNKILGIVLNGVDETYAYYYKYSYMKKG